MDIGDNPKRIKADPINPPVPVPRREPEPEPEPLVEPDRSPERESEPEKVYADPNTYAFEGWPEGHPVGEALKRL